MNNEIVGINNEIVVALRQVLADPARRAHPAFVSITVLPRGNQLWIRWQDYMANVSGHLGVIPQSTAVAIVPELFEELNVWRSAVRNGDISPTPTRRGPSRATDRTEGLARRHSA